MVSLISSVYFLWLFQPLPPLPAHSTCPTWRNSNSPGPLSRKGSLFCPQLVNKTTHGLFIWQKEAKAAWSPWRDTDLWRPPHTLTLLAGGPCWSGDLPYTDPTKEEHIYVCKCVKVYVWVSMHVHVWVSMCISMYMCVYIHMHDFKENFKIRPFFSVGEL